MGPINGIGMALGISDEQLLRKSLKNLAIMVGISLVASTLYFLISPISDARSELLARTQPTIFDVFIAFFGGLAGIVATSRIYSADSNNIGLNLELDAILAVALGGNSLGGGRFNLAGSIIGAYTIQAITTTMYALGVAKAQAPVYKAIIVILIVVVQSPAVKAYFAHRKAQKESLAIAGRS